MTREDLARRHRAKARREGRSTDGTLKIAPKIEAQIYALLRAGVGTRAITSEIGCGASVVVRIKRETVWRWESRDGGRRSSRPTLA